MKRLAVVFLLFLFVQCSKNETENRVFTVDQLRSAPRNYIPKENLPEWIVAKINMYEQHYYPYAQIAKGEWNEQIVYLSRNPFQSDFGTIYIEAEDREYSLSFANSVLADDYSLKGDFSTSKNWVVIYEKGDVMYPNNLYGY